MSKIRVDGIELLQKIKDNKLKTNTEIKVYYNDGLEEYITTIKYDGLDIIWKEKTFRTRYFYNKYIIFEIIEQEEKPKEIEKLETATENTLFTMECYTGIPEKAQDWNFNILKNKCDELTKAVNYLLKEKE